MSYTPESLAAVEDRIKKQMKSAGSESFRNWLLGVCDEMRAVWAEREDLKASLARMVSERDHFRDSYHREHAENIERKTRLEKQLSILHADFDKTNAKLVKEIDRANRAEEAANAAAQEIEVLREMYGTCSICDMATEQEPFQGIACVPCWESATEKHHDVAHKYMELKREMAQMAETAKAVAETWRVEREGLIETISLSGRRREAAEKELEKARSERSLESLLMTAEEEARKKKA